MQISMLVTIVFCGLATFCSSLSDTDYGLLLQLRNEIYTFQDNLNTQLDSMTGRMESLHKEAVLDTTVAGFTAIKISVQDVDFGNVITFTRELYDFGGNFDSERFHCPSHAVYFVTANLERDRDVEVVVLVNGLRQLSLRESRSNGLATEFNTVTNSMLVECDVGEDIWLEAAENGRIYGSDSDSRYVSTFTVFRLNDPFPGLDLPVPETYQPDTN